MYIERIDIVNVSSVCPFVSKAAVSVARAQHIYMKRGSEGPHTHTEMRTIQSLAITGPTVSAPLSCLLLDGYRGHFPRGKAAGT